MLNIQIQEGRLQWKAQGDSVAFELMLQHQGTNWHVIGHI